MFQLSEDTLHVLMYVFIAMVITGVTLEGAEHIKDFREKGWKEGWKPFAPKIGFVILVLGLCGELALEPLFNAAETDFRLDARARIKEAGRAAADANDRAATAEAQVGDAHARATEADRQAAEANMRAKEAEARISEAVAKAAEASRKTEDVRAANLALEHIMRPRRLTPDQEVELVRQASAFPGITATFEISPNDAEAYLFADQLRVALRNAGWNSPSQMYELDRVLIGVGLISTAHEPSRRAATVLLNILDDAGLQRLGANPGGLGGDSPEVTIRVGAKPPIDPNDPKARQ